MPKNCLSVFDYFVGLALKGLNGLPLTSISDDISDFEVPNRNHLLVGEKSPNQCPGNFREHELNFKRKWRSVQAETEMFWRRCVRDYLPFSRTGFTKCFDYCWFSYLGVHSNCILSIWVSPAKFKQFRSIFRSFKSKNFSQTQEIRETFTKFYLNYYFQRWLRFWLRFLRK